MTTPKRSAAADEGTFGDKLNDFPLITVTACVIVIVVTLVGGAITIWGEGLSYEDYLNNLWKLVAAAFATPAIARGAATVAKTIKG